MIRLLRIDDRLLHGQVAFSWTRSLSISDIIIANDEAANDEFSKMTLGLAKPRGVNLIIESLEKAVELVLQNESTRNNVIVIINNLSDAQKILNRASFIKSLNLGGLREREGSKRITGSVTLTSTDLDICRKLLDNEIEIEIRQVPEEKKILLKNMI